MICDNFLQEHPPQRPFRISRVIQCTMQTQCRVEPQRGQEFQQPATTSALLDYCIAPRKSGTGVEGTAAGDERRRLRVHGVEGTVCLWCPLVCGGVDRGFVGTIRGARLDSTEIDPCKCVCCRLARVIWCLDSA